jgi:NADH:ubiquinone oxidoreductase subunit 5 (subunit L)/multisubunit Na+/H+ antiporter MnhA subunit
MAFFEKPPISSPTHVFGLPWVASVQCNPFRAAQSHSEFPRSLTGIGTVVAMALPRDWPSSTLSVLRIVIVIIAGFLIWQFSDGYLLAWETLAEPTEARWFNVLSALCEGVLGPVLALSAGTIGN